MVFNVEVSHADCKKGCGVKKYRCTAHPFCGFDIGAQQILGLFNDKVPENFELDTVCHFLSRG